LAKTDAIDAAVIVHFAQAVPQGGWVMDVETKADRFVGIDVSKARV
jgi:hypothetical protein